MLVSRRIPPKAESYVRELADTYMLGFDAATIALACSCFEQLAKSALVVTGKMTEAQIKRERPKADELRRRLREFGMLVNSDGAAQQLIERRNTVLHQYMVDDKILPTLSLDSIRELLTICAELAPSWSAGE